MTHEEDISIFLENLGFGPILECKLARNYYGTLFLHREEANLLFKAKVERKKMEYEKSIDGHKL